TTVDVDADLIAQAAENLDQCGYRPTVAVCDGAEGYPPRAPYDRVLATCSVSRIPLAWLEQTVPGGLVVTTLNRPIGAGLVRITAGQGAYGQGWVLPDDGRFMPLRAHRRAAADELLPGMDTSTGQSRGTPLGAGELIAPGSQFEFYAGLSLPDVNVLGDDDG